jgi:AAA family ATP:ADP antiporter
MKSKNDRYAVILSFIYYFSVLAAYYVMRPIRDQLAAEAGSIELPWFFGATLLAMLLLTPLFSWVVSRYPRKIVMPLVYLFFIVCQFAFIPFFNARSSPHTLGIIFFVWVSVFNLFVVSVFWSFMTDIWNDAEARLLFPIIALGGTAGAITGPLLTRILVERFGQSSLLLVSIALLSLAIACIVLLGRWAHKFGSRRKEKNNESPIGGGMFDGLKQIFSTSFIRNMALIMLLSDAIGTIAYALVTDYSGQTFHDDPVRQTRFAADMDLSANILQVFVQLTITPWLLVRYGAGVVFVVCAAIVIAFCLMMALVQDPSVPIIGSMPIVALVLIVTRSLSHSMVQPARETLYTLVPRDLRYKGKNAVDTVVWRVGDVLSLLSINGFKALGVNIAGFGIIWAALAGVSGWIGWKLASRVEKGEFEKL